ncbi:MAG TPA: hypothetical protein VFO39_02915 [Candidatus Sulfotelmatobacter sp.]|nr:hypothetical protein [Candidatus Sulfotelmatobacter sp.]
MPSSALSAILWFLLCISAISQVSRQTERSDSSVCNGIQKGDIEQILEAGRSGDPSFISQLIAYRRKVGEHIEIHVARAIQLALAKLAQPAELQQIRCEFLFGSASMQYDAVDKLQYIAGWFSIEAFADVLDNPDYNRYRKMGQDSALAPLGWYAVRRLPSIIRDPPPIESGILLAGSERDLERQRKWKEWIRAHHDSLSKLPPDGTGVETSNEICQPVLERDRTVDHEKVHNSP